MLLSSCVGESQQFPGAKGNLWRPHCKPPEGIRGKFSTQIATQMHHLYTRLTWPFVPQRMVERSAFVKAGEIANHATNLQAPKSDEVRWSPDIFKSLIDSKSWVIWHCLHILFTVALSDGLWSGCFGKLWSGLMDESWAMPACLITCLSVWCSLQLFLCQVRIKWRLEPKKLSHVKRDVFGWYSKVKRTLSTKMGSQLVDLAQCELHEVTCHCSHASFDMPFCLRLSLELWVNGSTLLSGLLPLSTSTHFVRRYRSGIAS